MWEQAFGKGQEDGGSGQWRREEEREVKGFGSARGRENGEGLERMETKGGENKGHVGEGKRRQGGEGNVGGGDGEEERQRGWIWEVDEDFGDKRASRDGRQDREGGLGGRKKEGPKGSGGRGDIGE